MNIKFKYTESLKIYMNGRVQAETHDIVGWLGTLSDPDLSEFGQMVRLATRGKPIEDVARFIAVAMPRQEGQMTAPTKKILERFLVSTYSNIVLERKERLHSRGKLEARQTGHRHSCSCCSAGE